jgi:hypothetical protein
MTRGSGREREGKIRIEKKPRRDPQVRVLAVVCVRVHLLEQCPHGLDLGLHTPPHLALRALNRTEDMRLLGDSPNLGHERNHEAREGERYCSTMARPPFAAMAGS